MKTRRLQPNSFTRTQHVTKERHAGVTLYLFLYDVRLEWMKQSKRSGSQKQNDGEFISGRWVVSDCLEHDKSSIYWEKHNRERCNIKELLLKTKTRISWLSSPMRIMIKFSMKLMMQFHLVVRLWPSELFEFKNFLVKKKWERGFEMIFNEILFGLSCLFLPYLKRAFQSRKSCHES